METKRRRSEIITDFMNLMEKECTNTLPYVVEQRIKCDKATQDLLHQLELGDYKDRGRIATQLAHIRRDRRYYKDIEEEKAVSILNSEAFAELIQNKTLEGKSIELVQKPVNIMVKLASTLFQLLPTFVILAMVLLLFKMQGKTELAEKYFDLLNEKRTVLSLLQTRAALFVCFYYLFYAVNVFLNVHCLQ